MYYSMCVYNLSDCCSCCKRLRSLKRGTPASKETIRWKRSFGLYTIVHLALFSMVLVANALPPVIRVGAIFTEDEREGSVESAFKYAIYRINKEKILLPNTQLVYDIEYVPRDDSFRTTKKVCRQLEAGVQAIFGPSDPLLASHVQSICEAFDIPHIEARIDLEVSVKEFSINLYPSQNIMNLAYRDLMMYLNWTKVAIIYEEDYGLFKQQDLIHSSAEMRTEMYIRQANPETYRQVLRAIRQKEIYKIIVDTNPTNIKKFFRSILQLQMNDHRYHYMFTTFDLETYDLEDFRYNSVNITAFRLVDVGSKRYQDIIDQMQKLQHSGLDLINGVPYIQTESALMFDSVYAFAHGLKQLDSSHTLTFKNLSCNSDRVWSDGLSLYNYINSAAVDGLTGKVNFIEGRRNKFKIDILKLKQEVIQKVGFWQPDVGVNISDPTAFYDSNIANITLIVMTREERPYVMVKEDANITGNARFEGFCIDLLKAIAQQVGFQYKIELVPDNMYGVYIPETNSWNGIVQELMERRADLAVASMTINYARESVIDFTKPFMNLGIGILFKVPTSQPTRLFSFMNPLAIEIWLYVLAAYILVSFALFVMARFSPYEWKNPHPCYRDTDIVENQFSISNSFWFITGTFLRQGSGLNPKISDRAQTKFFSFMNPLAIEIWFYIAFGYILVSMCIWIVARLSPMEWVRSKPACTMACDHMLRKIRKANNAYDHFELKFIENPTNNGTHKNDDKNDANDVIDVDLGDNSDSDDTLELETVQNSFTLKNSFWFAIGALMQQGADLYPRATSTRIVGGCWFFFCLIIISSYTANLAAFLTVERMITPIESAADLADQTEIQYGTLEGGSTMTFFRDSKIGIYQKMWRYMENRKTSVFVKTYEDGIKRVMEGNYAFLMESTMLDYAVQRDCNLTQIGGLLDSKGYGIATPKGSPWRDKISLAILELQEKGIIQILYDKWWKNTGDVCNRDDKSKESKANALGVENIDQPTLILLKMDSEVETSANETKSEQPEVVMDDAGERVLERTEESVVENDQKTTTTTTVVVIKNENAKPDEELEADPQTETESETTTTTVGVTKKENESADAPDKESASATATTTTIVVAKNEPDPADASDKEIKTSATTTTVVVSPKKEEDIETEKQITVSNPNADAPSSAKETANEAAAKDDCEFREGVVVVEEAEEEEGEAEEEQEESDDDEDDDDGEDLKIATKTEEIKDEKGQSNIPEQSEVAAESTISQDENAVKSNKDINNQIENIISDIDINIKAQEKIAQLKEQELQLIQKQKELANQIQQQQLLAQKLIAENQLKEQELQRQKYVQQQPQPHPQSPRQYTEEIEPTIKQDRCSTNMFQRQEDSNKFQESCNISRTVDLRKIFTPATDAPQILPKNHYQQYQVNRPAAASPSIVPAYSDAGKHRVQLNLHQDQLIEKYSKPGVQVVKSPWEAALQTGSASTAFLDQSQYRSPTPIATQPSPVHFTQDFTDSPLPASYVNQSNYTQDSYKSSLDSQAKSQPIQPSNPQRELAYKPSVAQGWGGRNVELPREYYYQTQEQQEFINQNIQDLGTQYYYGNDQILLGPEAYGMNAQFHHPEFNLNDDIHKRLLQLEQFQQSFMQQQMKQLNLKSNFNLPLGKCNRNMSALNITPTKHPEVEEPVAGQGSSAEEVGESVNVRELIFSFEQQSLREPDPIQKDQREFPNDKKQSQFQRLNTSRDSINHIIDGATNKGLYVPKEISLASYAPPPVLSTPNFQSSPKPIDYSSKAYEPPPYNSFPVANQKSGLYNSVPPKQQLYNPTSYQKVLSGSQQSGPQVNFSPSPLSFDKLSKFQESSDQRNQRLLNVNKQPVYRGVQNVSPTPFLSAGTDGREGRSPISSPTYGSHTSHNAGSQKMMNGGNQSFNNCARGWNKGSNNIQQSAYYPKTVPVAATESLPYSDF
ncbi:uncharacterized protein LOC6585822 isoform X8 [Drosophila mojavensis]|nr:uncharacterized protein LOC6585822 isoform X8 [Drosophila mojavensis]